MNASATWRIEDHTLVLRKHRRGIASVLDFIPGMGLPEDRIPILSVTENELLAGSEATPIAYERPSGNLPPIAR